MASENVAQQTRTTTHMTQYEDVFTTGYEDLWIGRGYSQHPEESAYLHVRDRPYQIAAAVKTIRGGLSACRRMLLG